MGIKISGFMLGQSSLGEAFAMLNGHRPTSRQMVEDATAKFLATNAQTRIDMAVLFPDDERRNEEAKKPLSAANAELDRRQKAIRESGYRDIDVDFGFEVVLYPVEGKVFGSIFAEQSSFRQWLLNLPGVSEFSYYDGSDSYLSRGITQEQWEERLRLWSLALGDFRLTPSEAGVTMNLGQSMVLPRTLDVIGQIDTKEVRADRYARKFLCDELMNKKLDGVDRQDTSNIIRALDAAMDFIATPEGAAEVNLRATDIFHRLPCITQATLLGH